MPFLYSSKPHVRKHGPAGYRVPGLFKPWLRDEFVFRCVYCLERETWYPSRDASFSVDHVVPSIQAPGRINDYTNLVYACLRCNSAKRDVLTIDPTLEPLGRHLRIRDDYIAEGLTPEGADLIDLLHLNCVGAVSTRPQFSKLAVLVQLDPRVLEIDDLYLQAFQFPADLPNLATLRPPEGNSAKGSETNCFFSMRQEGRLPPTY